VKDDIMIRVAKEEDIEAALEVLGYSFYHDPFFTWAVEDEADRMEVVSAYYRVYMRHCLTNGVTHLAYKKEDELLGVSVWLSNDARGDRLSDDIERAVGKYVSRFRVFGQRSYLHEPQDTYFSQLIGFGVVPAAQGMGIGLALLEYHGKELDAMGKSSYIEASTQRSFEGVYKRAGYQPIGEVIPFSETNKLYPLWRPAKSTASETPVRKKREYVLDSVIRFGKYDWRVLDVQDDKVLIITEKVLETKAYHINNEPVVWENCSLRHYLNNEFYHTFTDAEKEDIALINITNYGNQWFGNSSGGGTMDYIFLLSIDGTVKYFGDSRQLRGGNENDKHFIDDEFNNARKAVTPEGEPSSWWLRTAGSDGNLTASVTTDGRISVSGDFVNRDFAPIAGVRPLLWLSQYVKN